MIIRILGLFIGILSYWALWASITSEEPFEPAMILTGFIGALFILYALTGKDVLSTVINGANRQHHQEDRSHGEAEQDNQATRLDSLRRFRWVGLAAIVVEILWVVAVIVDPKNEAVMAPFVQIAFKWGAIFFAVMFLVGTVEDFVLNPRYSRAVKIAMAVCAVATLGAGFFLAYLFLLWYVFDEIGREREALRNIEPGNEGGREAAEGN